MMSRCTPIRLAILTAAVVASPYSLAQINVQSDGSDGALTIGWESRVLDLSLAPTGSWSSPAPIPGRGVYDPTIWAVVYKFSTASMDSHGVLSFIPHPSGCPVVFLVDGNADMAGSISLNGGNGNGISQSLPGPGGFRGGAGRAGVGVDGSAGFGPGGGGYQNGNYGSSGSFAEAGTGPLFGALYGNPKCIPLIGGSGGSGRGDSAVGAGAGGGAILIACKNRLTIGHIGARGGSGNDGNAGSGSGGAIRLVADQIVMPGSLDAGTAGGGGVGRIRIEANTTNITGEIVPLPSVAVAGTTPQLFQDSTTPKLQILSVGGTNAPVDPRSNLYSPDIDLTSSGTKTIQVAAYNVPTDNSWSVQVRMTPKNGAQSVGTCTYVSGNQGYSVWQCQMSVGTGTAALIARAYKN